MAALDDLDFELVNARVDKELDMDEWRGLETKSSTSRMEAVPDNFTGDWEEEAVAEVAANDGVCMKMELDSCACDGVTESAAASPRENSSLGAAERMGMTEPRSSANRIFISPSLLKPVFAKLTCTPFIMLALA